MSTFDSSAHPRTSAGVSTGGQFTTKTREESGVELAAAPRPRVHEPGSLADLGVPVGLQQGMGERDIAGLKRQINEQGLDRAGARDAAIRWHRWYALSRASHRISLFGARGDRDNAATQLRRALETRNALTMADGEEAIGEAERDLINAHIRYRLADDDVKVLTGAEPVHPSAHERVADPKYAGQLVPWPEENVVGRWQAAPEMIAVLPEDLRLPEAEPGTEPGTWRGQTTRTVRLDESTLDRLAGARVVPVGFPDAGEARIARDASDAPMVATDHGRRYTPDVLVDVLEDPAR
ncbi:hypothetical protein [Cellulosimicrobium sp. Marseille-Q4280]|uniref:hypothetical protein n=1 Tax=Cellulosimicrobium sp. Marseille-Q4280 TaxID=2937992 RepID=UPI00203EAC9E|nr:hypothetical protein [Cellulosimicrobium sp. Marseille-Q4280]